MDPVAHNDPSDGSDSSELEESLGGVFGVGFGLFLIAVCVLAVVFYGPRRLDAAELLTRDFSLGESFAGLELEPQARVLTGGEQVFTFSDGLPIEVALQELILGKKKEQKGRNGQRDEVLVPYDWSAIEVQSSDAPPARFYLVHFPRKRAEATLRGAFQGLEWKDLSEIGAQGGTAVVGGGKLDWEGYDADWVRERRFLAGGSFRDTMRVNLSLGQECWIGYAIWRERQAGCAQALGEVLAGLELRPDRT